MSLPNRSIEQYDLGAWQEFIGMHENPPGHTVPESLHRDLLEYRPRQDDLRHLSPSVFETIFVEIRRWAGQYAEQFNPAYHNTAHFDEVVVDATALLSASTTCPGAINQAVILAAAGHDFAHPGYAIRQEAISAGVPVIQDLSIGLNPSNEQISAYMVDLVLKQHPTVTAPMRLLIYRLIWATTFGNPKIAPVSELERLVVSADLSPNESFLDWYKKAIDITFREHLPGGMRPVTWDEWVQCRCQFFRGYLQENMTPDALHIWQSQIHEIERCLRMLEAAPVTAEEIAMNHICRKMVAEFLE